MRRAVLTLGGTLAGLAALLSFKTHSLAAPAPAASTTPRASTGTSQAVTSGTGSRSAAPAASKTASATHRATPNTTPTASAAAPAATRAITGTVVDTPYGPMQVQVTLTGTKITNVAVLQQTDNGAESSQIDATAIPRLTSETLAAQSARIDAVSGASYTSSGYIQSLQSALDQANA